MSSDLVAQSNKMLALAQKAALQQSTTIAMHGLNPDDFAGVLVEALHANPKVANADQTTLIRVLRRACQDGVLPNGREAALIISNKDGSCSYQVMRDGWARIFHRAFPGSELLSGYVREGNDVKITHDTEKGDKVKLKTSFAGQDPKADVIGSWCLIKVKGFLPFAHVFYADDVAKAKAASNTKSGGAWNVWEGRMAEKAVVKSAIRKALYMYPVDAQAKANIEKSLDADDEEEFGDEIIEADAEVVDDVEVAEEPPKQTKKRLAKPAPKQEKAEPKKAKTTKKQPEPVEVVEQKGVEVAEQELVEPQDDDQGQSQDSGEQDDFDFGIDGDEFE